MIPKIIHFCWMSDDRYPSMINKCIDSWKTVMPDYQIIKWDTSNFDISLFPYAEQAMSVNKYAFVSDIVRLYSLYQIGGIYLDSDIQVYKRFDSLLKNKAFTGFEDENNIGVWLLASEPHNPIFKEMLDCYKGKNFILPDGTMDMTPNPQILAPIFVRHGLKLNNTYQKLDNITVYPTEYFCPLDYTTGSMNRTDNTYCIHLFNGAWMPSDAKHQEELCRNYYAKMHFIPFKWVRKKLAVTGAVAMVYGISEVINRARKKAIRLMTTGGGHYQ